MGTLPSNVDLQENRSGDFLRVTVPFIPLSTIAVMIRFWSRVVSREKVWWDDWTCLLAWAMGILLLILGIVCTHYGIGRHVGAVDPNDLVISGKIFYVAYMAFTAGICLVKSSALFFYARIFNVVPSFRLALNICHSLTVIWFISNMPLIIWNCSPIDKFWYKLKPGHCISLYLWHMSEGMFDAVLNLVILILPVPRILKLQVPWGRKVLLIVAFFFGYLALIPSIGRVISTAQLGKDIEDDFIFDVTDLEWSFLETSICVISLCIPSWFQLANRAHLYGIKSLFTRRNQHVGPVTIKLGDRPQHSTSFQRLHGDAILEHLGQGQFQAQSRLARLDSAEDVILAEDAIRVQRDVIVTNESKSAY